MSKNFVNSKYMSMFDIRTQNAIAQTPEHLRDGVIEAEVELAKIRMGFSPNTPDEVVGF